MDGEYSFTDGADEAVFCTWDLRLPSVLISEEWDSKSSTRVEETDWLWLIFNWSPGKLGKFHLCCFVSEAPITFYRRIIKFIANFSQHFLSFSRMLLPFYPMETLSERNSGLETPRSRCWNSLLQRNFPILDDGGKGWFIAQMLITVKFNESYNLLCNNWSSYSNIWKFWIHQKKSLVVSPGQSPSEFRSDKLL